ncbi:hypothetical protein Acr_00g0021420 [Actinidia rufa]|uniref:Uncharacterized protein n=1 Tax=Actinidia rufa TaxID=165716 RepID=A0A7J0DDL8_9ERIC|nr:hypothetical protein Acr_00g0021420 [Actinidia rufa]
MKAYTMKSRIKGNVNKTMEEATSITRSKGDMQSVSLHKVGKTKAWKRKPVNKPGERKNVSYRSRLAAIVKLMNKISLRKEHIEELKKSPFWFLFDALLKKKLDLALCRKSDTNVVKIIGAYRNGNNFKLGQKNSKQDIKLIFGISCGDQVMNLSNGNKETTYFVRRRSLETESLTA